jgi:hypothetical protein
MQFAYHDRPVEPRHANEDPELWAEIARWAEAQCEDLFAIVYDIAKTGCQGGVCANSLDVCREMREKARMAIESYGRPSDDIPDAGGMVADHIGDATEMVSPNAQDQRRV